MNNQVLAQEIGAEAVAHIMHTLIEVRGISYTRVLDFINIGLADKLLATDGENQTHGKAETRI